MSPKFPEMTLVWYFNTKSHLQTLVRLRSLGTKRVVKCRRVSVVWMRRPSVNINNFHRSVPHHCKERTLLRHLAVSPATQFSPSFLLSIFLLSGMKQLCGNEASAHRTKTLPHSSFCFKYTFFFFFYSKPCVAILLFMNVLFMSPNLLHLAVCSPPRRRTRSLSFILFWWKWTCHAWVSHPRGSAAPWRWRTGALLPLRRWGNVW